MSEELVLQGTTQFSSGFPQILLSILVSEELVLQEYGHMVAEVQIHQTFNPRE